MRAKFYLRRGLFAAFVAASAMLMPAAYAADKADEGDDDPDPKPGQCVGTANVEFTHSDNKQDVYQSNEARCGLPKERFLTVHVDYDWGIQEGKVSFGSAYIAVESHLKKDYTLTVEGGQFAAQTPLASAPSTESIRGGGFKLEWPNEEGTVEGVVGYDNGDKQKKGFNPETEEYIYGPKDSVGSYVVWDMKANKNFKITGYSDFQQGQFAQNLGFEWTFLKLASDRKLLFVSDTTFTDNIPGLGGPDSWTQTVWGSGVRFNEKKIKLGELNGEFTLTGGLEGVFESSSTAPKRAPVDPFAKAELELKLYPPKQKLE